MFWSPVTPPARFVATLALVAALCASCGSPRAATPSASTAPASAAREQRAGIEVERLQGPAAEEGGDGIVTLVRFDMARYRLVLLAANEGDGVWHTIPEWAQREHLVAGINAALFEPDGRVSGLLVREGQERSPDDERFGGWLAFDPHAAHDGAFVLTGRDCAGRAGAGQEDAAQELSRLRAAYGTLIGNYRLLDCEGAGIEWVDERRYSSAAFGVDRDGRFVMIHAETPYRMRDLSAWLARPSLRLTQVHYVEGGPKATLYLDQRSAGPILLTGSRADEEGRTREPRGPRPIPNVLGMIER